MRPGRSAGAWFCGGELKGFEVLILKIRRLGWGLDLGQRQADADDAAHTLEIGAVAVAVGNNVTITLRVKGKCGCKLGAKVSRT